MQNLSSMEKIPLSYKNMFWWHALFSTGHFIHSLNEIPSQGWENQNKLNTCVTYLNNNASISLENVFLSGLWNYIRSTFAGARIICIIRV